MATQPWLDEVLSRLANQGLPPDYVRRFAEELSDHLEDLKSDNNLKSGIGKEDAMSTEADVVSRLGKPEQVATAAVAAYRQRSFPGRHPTAAFLVFAVSPVAVQIIQFVLCLLAIRLTTMIADQFGVFSDGGRYVPPSFLTVGAFSYVTDLACILVPTIVAGVLYRKLADQLGGGRKWMLASFAVLAAMTLLPCWCIRIGADAAGHAHIASGLSVPFLSSAYGWLSICSNAWDLVQAAVPLAIGWWFLRRLRSRDRPQLAS
jgi:hypothetical protein